MTKILIADDDVIFGRNLMEILQRHGYHVECVESGDLAIEKLQQASFDVLLLDLVMPDQNGIATTRRLRDQNIGVRIIIMTAYGSREITEEAIESGVQGFIKKPFDIPSLIEIITPQALPAQKEALAVGG